SARAHENGLRQRYESLSLIAAGGWWEYNPQEYTVTLSEGLVALLDLQENVLSRDQWLQHLDPLDRDTFLVHVNEALQGRDFVHPYRLRTDGRSIWYRFDAQLLGEDRDQRLLGFAMDINSLRQ